MPGIVAAGAPVGSRRVRAIGDAAEPEVRRMRIGMPLNYAGGFQETVGQLADYERAGLDVVSIPEAYSFDAVSQLGYVAAVTERLELMAGILQIYTRTPSLTAMTAAGLDYVSNGRFSLGLGASGPQVIEGFHGVKYDAPLGRTREVVEICRKVWAREKVEYDGTYYQVPLPADQGTGLGKPLKLINHPVRSRIPITIASIGPKNVELTAEIAEGWLPIFYYPERAAEVWGEPLAAGKAKRDPELPPLDTVVQAALAIGDDVEQLADYTRPQIALYVGGMGARDKNFYNQLACRYGFEAEAQQIQDLYLSGKKEDAAKAVPTALVQGTSLIGPAGYVKERIAAYAETGATTLMVTPFGNDHAERVRLIEQVKELAG
jgi:F420-dependent oxidoreductase-like protein